MARIRVAVIDDEKSSAEAFARLLRSDGLDSSVFSSAEEFLSDPAAPGIIDCAIVDVLMPQVDGLKLQETLAESSPYLSIVFVTGNGTVPITVKAMKSGAVDVLE